MTSYGQSPALSMQTSEAPEVIATALDNGKAAMQCCIADAYCNVASDFGRVINAAPKVGRMVGKRPLKRLNGCLG